MINIENRVENKRRKSMEATRLGDEETERTKKGMKADRLASSTFTTSIFAFAQINNTTRGRRLKWNNEV
jgi:hypothetical protein